MSWRQAAHAYKAVIEDPGWDSKLIRDLGLIPNVVEFVGDCGGSSLLDVGTGTGWLFSHVRPRAAYACDVVESPGLPDFVEFKKSDAHKLDYESDRFDVVVASLLLMFCRDLARVCSELHRVAESGARLVVSLVHPYFYRTGYVDQRENFVLAEPLGREKERTIRIAERVDPVRYFYRPLPDYVTALVRAGWKIEQMRDWFVDMDRYRAMGSGIKSELKRTGKVPMYCFLACRALKPM